MRVPGMRVRRLDYRAGWLRLARLLARFQSLEPIEDDDHAGWRHGRIAGGAVLEHQEALAVRGHVVMACGKRLRVFAVEYLRRIARTERGPRRLYRHRDQRVGGIEVEQLAAIPSPRGARSARCRNP